MRQLKITKSITNRESASLDKYLQEIGKEGDNGTRPKIDEKFINGLDRKSVNLLKLYAKGKLPGNFVEVMACAGGCVGGPCSLAR